MSKNRRLRASLAVVAAVGIVLTMTAPADAARPKRISPPQVSVTPTSPSRSTTATFSWTEATPGVTFACSLDGGSVPCGNPAGRTFTGLSERTHTFTVVATKTGWRSATSSASYTVDLTPPAPPSVSTVPGVTNNVLNPVKPTFSDTSSDVASYQCSLDGAAFSTCSSGAQINASPDGYHSLAVKAVDRVGNVSASTTVSWIVKTSVQAPFIITGPANPTSYTSADFTFDSHEIGATFDCAIDGGSFVACDTKTASYPAGGAASPGKSHTFTVRSHDAYGNSATASFTWKVVTGGGVTSLAWNSLPSLASAVSPSRTLHVTYTTTPGATVTCTLDGAPLATCTSTTADMSGLSDGTHTLVVTAAASGSASTSLTYTWNVDATPPAAPAIYGPPALTRVRNATIVVVPASLDDLFTCKLDGVTVTCSLTTPITTGVLADGTHTVSVQVTDRAGNVTNAQYSWTVDTTPPAVVSMVTPTSVDGAAVVTFTENVTSAGFSPSLTLSSGGAVATRRVCLSVAAATVDCASTSVRSLRLFGASLLVPGEHYVVQLNAAGVTPLTDVAGNPAISSSTAFRAAVTQQENGPATVQTWRTVRTTAAKGGSFVTETRPGAAASWRFSGTHFTAYLASGPTFGLAKVYVDGILKGTWNQYAAALKFTSARTVRGLANTSHTVTVLVTGIKGSRAATGASVGIDAFAAATLQKSPALTMRWARVYAKAASGSYRALAVLPGETFAMTFAGVGVRWAHPVGPAYGIAVVYVDGVKKATIDSYAASAKEQVLWSSATLAAGRHTIQIVTLGTKRAASKGTTVGVDFLQAR